MIPINTRFSIHFEDDHTALAIRTPKDGDARDVVRALGLLTPRPAIFISGGASAMTDEDKEKTNHIIEEGIAKFAAQNGVTVIDGGTESGVMEMIGSARRNHHYTFPLVGVAPRGKVQYPGSENPEHEAELEDSHSHFILVEGDNWGDESGMISAVARAISGDGVCPVVGILINGGRVSQQDVLLATTRGEKSIPILVLEGSGRFADQLATAFKTGKTNQSILKAIIQGGDIELVATVEGPDAIYSKLAKRFSRV